MKNRTRFVALTAALAASSLVASPAHAEDTRPCVTRYEFKSFPANPGTRASIESYWDVRGTNARNRVHADDPLPLGLRQNLDDGSVLYSYRWCEHGPKRGAFYVFYRKSDMTWWLTASWHDGQSPVVASRR